MGGIIFSREAILNYLLEQTRRNKRKSEALEKQMKEKKQKIKQELEQKTQIEISNLKKKNQYGIRDRKDHSIVNKSQNTSRDAQIVESSQILVTSGSNIAINRERIK